MTLGVRPSVVRALAGAALLALALGPTGGAAHAFNTTGAGYVCVDNEDTAGNPPVNAWDNISAAPQLLFDDDTFAPVTLPFTFNFMGQAWTECFVGSNGFITFGDGSSTPGNGAIPNAGEPNNAIYGFWDDLDPASGGSVRGQTLGTAPNRRHVVSWINVPHFQGAGLTTVSFQIALFEAGGANAIRVQYETLTGSQQGGSATIGVENAAGTQAIQYWNLGAPAGNNPYPTLAIGFWPTGATPPWAAAGPPPPGPGAPPGGGAGAFVGRPDGEIDGTAEELHTEMCGAGASSAGMLAALAAALGLAVALARGA